MTTDAIYEERGSDWSHQVSAVGTTQWLQHDQTLPLSAKGVASKPTFPPDPVQSKWSRVKTEPGYEQAT